MLQKLHCILPTHNASTMVAMEFTVIARRMGVQEKKMAAKSGKAREMREFPKPNFECQRKKSGLCSQGEVDSMKEGFIFGSQGTPKRTQKNAFLPLRKICSITK